MGESSQDLRWVHETVPYWNADKARIVGGAEPGSLPASVQEHAEGAVLPDDWWRVELAGRTIAYGWMDVTWGDAEILLAVDAQSRGRGVGSFILEQLESEARARGINYIYNQVLPEHPAHGVVTSWLQKRSFSTTEAGEGTLGRSVIQQRARTG